MNTKVYFSLGILIFLLGLGPLSGQSMGEMKQMGYTDLEILKKNTEPDYPIELSEAEWRQRLDSSQYNVLRMKGTERAFTGGRHHVVQRPTVVHVRFGLAVGIEDLDLQQAVPPVAC